MFTYLYIYISHSLPIIAISAESISKLINDSRCKIFGYAIFQAKRVT